MGIRLSPCALLLSREKVVNLLIKQRQRVRAGSLTALCLTLSDRRGEVV